MTTYLDVALSTEIVDFCRLNCHNDLHQVCAVSQITIVKLQSCKGQNLVTNMLKVAPKTLVDFLTARCHKAIKKDVLKCSRRKIEYLITS